MIVNETVRNFVYRQRLRNFDFETIARNLSDYMLEEVEPRFVETLWNALCASGWVKAKKNLASKDRAPAETDPVALKFDLRRRNIQHLIDLKRAGHSPTRTEYVISAGGKGVRFPTVQRQSYLGSSAASCAETV